MPRSDAGHFELRRRRLDLVGWLPTVGEPTPAASRGVRVPRPGFSWVLGKNVGNNGGVKRVTSERFWGANIFPIWKAYFFNSIPKSWTKSLQIFLPVQWKMEIISRYLLLELLLEIVPFFTES